MSGNLALVLCLLGSTWLVALDAAKRPGVSTAIWIPFVWIVLISSKSPSTWLSAGETISSAAAAYDAGNAFDRVIYFALILIALLVLNGRRLSAQNFVTQNRWLVIFLTYALLSTLWSDQSLVAIKRWIKDVGNLLMVLLILTEPSPSTAARAVIYRVAAFLLPLCAIFIKFVPELGRTYHTWSGEVMFTGVTTHKNSLGALAMICCLFLLWEYFSRRDGKSPAGPGLLTLSGLLGLAGWLLIISRSATALLCTIIGASLLWAFRFQSVRAEIRRWWFMVVVVGLTAWLLDASLGLSRFIIVDLLGRDPTLTTRTEIWPILSNYVQNPLFGAGFNSFWTGERLTKLYADFGIIQAHNGYLETYLNTGLIGVCLLSILLLSTIKRLNRGLSSGDALSALQLTLLVVALVHNISEASFSKMSPIWLLLLLALTRYTDEVRHKTQDDPVRPHMRRRQPHEPPRVSRRLQPLRGWSDENSNQVFPRSPRASRAPGSRIPK